MVHIDQNVTTEPYGWIDIALTPYTASDTRDIAWWLQQLLRRIHREVH